MKIIKKAGNKEIKLSKKEWLSIGKQAQWISPEEIQKNMDEFIEDKQQTNPSADDFAIDMRGRKFAVPSNLKSKAIRILHEFGRNYHNNFPDIFEALGSIGIIVLQEDGTRWSGMIGSQGECGSEKANNAPPIRLQLAANIDGTYQLCKNDLIMAICTMPSGKLEIVAYLS